MVSSYVDHHVQLKNLSKKDLKFLSKPWINLKIQRLIKYRDKLMRKLNRKFTHNNEYLYKKFRNRVVNELRTSKTKYYNQYFAEHKSNMKMLWSGIKSIINIKNIKFNAISQLVQNGEIIDKPGEMAFNHYFTHIASKIDADIPRTRKSPFPGVGSMGKSMGFMGRPWFPHASHASLAFPCYAKAWKSMGSMGIFFRLHQQSMD